MYYDGLDRVVNEINERFSSAKSVVLMSLGDVVANASPTDNSFEVVAEFYQLDKENLKVEKQWYQTLTTVKDKSATPCQIAEEMQLKNLNQLLPQFWKAVQILATTPVTSCLSERSFSSLRRLKTYLRNTMSSGRVSNLAVINIEGYFANRVDISSVIDVFRKRRGRDQHFFESNRV